MAQAYTVGQVVKEKLKAKTGGGNALDGELAAQNDVVTMVQEGHGGAVGYDNMPTPAKVIVVSAYYGPADPKDQDHISIDITPPPGSVLTQGSTITAPQAEDGFDATLILLKADGTLITLKNGQSHTVAPDPPKIPNPDSEEVKTATSHLLDIKVGDLVLDFKKLEKGSNFKINSPVGTAGIRG